MTDTYVMNEAEDKFFQTGQWPDGEELPKVEHYDPDEETEVEAEAPALAPAAVTPDPEPAPAPAPYDLDSDPRYQAQQRQFEQERQMRLQLEKSLKELTDKVTNITAPAAPNPETDPYGHLMHTIKGLSDKIEAMQTARTNDRQQDTQATQQQQFQNAVTAALDAFKKDHPDYEDAIKHLRAEKSKELAGLGYSRQEAEEKMNREELDICIRTLSNGKSPAAVGYEMAKRYGYKAPPPAQNPESKVEAIKKGLKADTPKGAGAPANEVAGQHTKETLSNLSNEDLNKAVQGDNWEKLFGRKSSKDIF